MPLKEARAIAEKIAVELGYELVDVELTKEPGGHFLRFYIDRPEGVSLNELGGVPSPDSAAGGKRRIRLYGGFFAGRGSPLEDRARF